ncbi:MAG: hypothetical protein IJL66_03535 [Lachnospiraceae bacterium]|nr:hypothetical protein [Lachnospiraceae bacterium]
MFTSDTDLRRFGRGYLLAAAAVLLFGTVYEAFSFGVISPFMLGACLLPFLLGCVPVCLWLQGLLPAPSLWVRRLQLGAVCTLTAGCILRGALDIYGTTNRLLLVYPAAGILLFLGAAVLQARAAVRQRSARR